MLSGRDSAPCTLDRNGSYVILSLALAIAAASPSADCSRWTETARGVDTTFVRQADFDGDGAPDEVRLRIVARRLDEPFDREITVVSKGKMLLQRKTVDTWLDAAFKTETFGLPCSENLQCKCEWYTNRILQRVVQAGSSLGRGVFDDAAVNSIQRIAVDDLVRNCGATPAAARSAIPLAVARLRHRTSVFLVLPISPAQSEPPLFWFPEFSCFARIYED